MLLAETFEREKIPLTKPRHIAKAILKICKTFTCEDTRHIANSFCKSVLTIATIGNCIFQLNFLIIISVFLLNVLNKNTQ